MAKFRLFFTFIFKSWKALFTFDPKAEQDITVLNEANKDLRCRLEAMDKKFDNIDNKVIRILPDTPSIVLNKEMQIGGNLTSNVDLVLDTIPNDGDFFKIHNFDDKYSIIIKLENGELLATLEHNLHIKFMYNEAKKSWEEIS